MAWANVDKYKMGVILADQIDGAVSHIMKKYCNYIKFAHI